MRFTLGITTRYIDCHLTASMTNNPLVANQSCEQQITALSKVCYVNKSYALGHMNVVFSLVATTHLQP
jgi:hypothetical protein